MADLSYLASCISNFNCTFIQTILFLVLLPGWFSYNLSFRAKTLTLLYSYNAQFCFNFGLWSTNVHVLMNDFLYRILFVEPLFWTICYIHMLHRGILQTRSPPYNLKRLPLLILFTHLTYYKTLVQN